MKNKSMIKKFFLRNKFTKLFIIVVFALNFVTAIGAFAKNAGVSSWFPSLNSIKSYFVKSDIVQPVSNENLMADSDFKPGTDKSLLLKGSGFVEIINKTSHPTSAFTIETWLKYVGTGKTQGIIQIITEKNEDIRIEITKDGNLECSFLDGSSNLDKISSVQKLVSNEWHHVAIVFKEGVVTLFVDGNLSDRQEILLKSFNLNGNIKIGLTSEKGAKNYFNGLIDELRIANFAKYQQRAYTEKNSLGALLDNSYFGLWRFENQEITDHSADKNDGKMIGKAWLSDEIYDEDLRASSVPAAYCGTTPVDNTVCRAFDEWAPYVQLENAYNDVSFYSTEYNHTFITNNFAGVFTGVSFPNKMSGWYLGVGLNYFTPLTVQFTAPVDNLSFRVIGLNNHGYYAKVQVFQQSGAVILFNLVGYGPGVPVDYYFGSTTCGTGLCNQITKIVIYDITDHLGISYDNFSYTPSPGSGTPTPTITATPTPTPSPVAKPANFRLTPDIGKVIATWEHGQDGDPAEFFRVYRTTSANGEQLVATVSGPLEYVDTDVKIKHNYSYRVVAVKDIRTRSTASISEFPRSVCDQYDNILPPDLGLPDVPFSKHGWTGKYGKGKYIEELKLNGRYLGAFDGIRYINVKTNKMTAPKRLRLYHKEDQIQSDDNGEFLSKSIGYWVDDQNPRDLTLNCDFCVSSPSGQAGWIFTIRYIFSNSIPQDQCEPTATLRCSKFFPLASYRYESPVEFNEQSESVEIVQQLFYREKDRANAVGLFQDCETFVFLPPYPGDNNYYQCFPLSFPFSARRNPLMNETNAMVIRNGSLNNFWDNIHTTHNPLIREPGSIGGSGIPEPAGCPECIHDHWRWTSYASRIRPGVPLESLPLPFFTGNVTQFRNGMPLIGWKYFMRVPQAQYTVPKQDVEIGIVIGGRGAEAFPIDYRTLANAEPLHDSTPGGGSTNRYLDFWYAATSREPNIVAQGKNTATDLVHAHGGFFNPLIGNLLVSLIESKDEKNNKSKPNKKATNAIVDGPISVQFEHVYQNGNTTFTPFNTGSIVLPAGYTALNTTGHLIETTTVASGDHIVSFKADSVSSSEVFGNLRILQAQFDQFDPLIPKWVDVTILSPDPQGPDFPTRTIKARTEGLGKFIIAVFNPNLPLLTTNMKVELTDSPDPVRSDNNLTYNLTVRNISANAATSVRTLQVLPPNFRFVSASPNQGTCRLGVEDEPLHEDHANFDSTIYCHLGTMAGNSNLTIPVVVLPTEGEATFPPAGTNFSSAAAVTSTETDTDGDDNLVEAATVVLPSLNARPSVAITSPADNQIIISPILNPTPIVMTMTASDTDGTITKVEVFDDDTFLGLATPTGGNQYEFTRTHSAYGHHSLVARATDNGGRTSTSAAVKVLVNGTADLTITKPIQDLSPTGQNLLIETTSTVPTTRVQKVELFSSGEKIGTMRQVATSGSLFKHQFSWVNPPTGKPALTAVLTEYSGAVTISNTRHLTISSSPSIVINTPVDGITYQQASFLPIRVELNDSDGYVEKVDYYINGGLIGTTGGNIRSGVSTFNWQNPGEGIYTLVVIARDDLGVSTTSSPITFGINRPVTVNGELIWVDDQVPTGATFGGDDGWNWVGINPASLLGNAGHQSLLKNGQHEHYFENASQKLPVISGEKLTAWVFIDPEYIPSEIMLQFNDGQGWEHRAYWGNNLINLGTDGTASRIRIGDVPAAGKWIQLSIPANLVGLVGQQVSGMKFTMFNGRATWDRVGKLAASAQTPPPSGDFIWVEDEPPTGSVLSTVNDTWTDGTWISNPHYSGSLAHRHYEQATNAEYRQHAFTNPINSMLVNPGETLFTYVYLNPDSLYKPDTLVLQWYDDVTGWNHRAYWGRSARDVIGFTGGSNTESWRYMGPVPSTLGAWVRLEIPASYVGLEGKLVKGMSFGIYQKNRNGRAVWDYSGKTSSAPTTTFEALKFTNPLWRYHCGAGSAYRTEYKMLFDYDFFGGGCNPGQESGFIYDYPAPGTIPLHAYESADNKWFLTVCTLPSCIGAGWNYRYVLGHVIHPSDTTTTDAVWHQLWSCNSNYYYTTSTTNPGGCTYVDTAGYKVHTH